MNLKMSPGKITAIWIILRIVHGHGKILKTDLSQIAKSTSLRGGGLPIDDGIKLAIDVGFLILNDEIIILHDSCKDIVLSYCGEEPTVEIIRELLSMIIVRSKPTWTSFISRPIEERIFAISSDWIEVLNSVNLIELPLTNDASKWWLNLQKSFEQIEKDFLEKIGEIGESHSIIFEKKRLIHCSMHDLSDNIIWISKINDDYGFDISSFFGELILGNMEKDKGIFIEVKSTVNESKNSFYFILTRNEWNKALENMDTYFFHLWRKVRKTSTSSSAEGPLIILAKKIEKLIPINQNEDSYWTKCRVNIDYSVFKNDILDPKNILNQ